MFQRDRLFSSGGKVELGLVPLGCVGMIVALVLAAIAIEHTAMLVVALIIIGAIAASPGAHKVIDASVSKTGFEDRFEPIVEGFDQASQDHGAPSVMFQKLGPIGSVKSPWATNVPSSAISISSCGSGRGAGP